MRVALVVMGAVIAGLVDASVTPFIDIAGARPDLLLITTLAVTVTIGSEAGFVWAFAGGLTLDLLMAPGRPIGSTVVALLLVAGAAAVVARVAGRNHVAMAIVLTLPLAIAYRLLLSVLVAAVLGGGVPMNPLAGGLWLAILDTVLVVPLAVAGRWAWVRWAAHDRIEW